MALFDLRTLNGGVVHVAGASVIRVTLSHANEHGSVVTRVDLSSGPQLTPTPIDDVAAAAKAAGGRLIELTVPDESAQVWVSATAFTILQPADSFIDPPGARTVLRGAAALRQSVHEEIDSVQAAISAALQSA